MEFRLPNNKDENGRKWTDGDSRTKRYKNSRAATSMSPPVSPAISTLSTNGLLWCKTPSPGKQSSTASQNVNICLISDYIVRGRKSRKISVSECNIPNKRLCTVNRRHSKGRPSYNKLAPRDMERTTMVDSMREFRNHKMPVPKNKNKLLYNTKVQLIKLEQVCEKFQDYSASEIELLTDRYINLLMNSNFSCITKPKPKLISQVKHKPSSVEDELSCWSVGFLNKANDEDVQLSNEIIEEIIIIANTEQGPDGLHKEHSANNTDNEQEIVSFLNFDQTHVGKKYPQKLWDLSSDLSLLVKNEEEIKMHETEMKEVEEVKEEGLQGIEVKAMLVIKEEERVQEIEVKEEVQEINVEEVRIQEMEVKEEVKEENEHSLEIIALVGSATMLECTDNSMTFVTEDSLNQHQNCNYISEVETRTDLKNAKSESHLKSQEPLASNNFSSINIPLKNLEVQLIRLEAICNNFEDYSANGIDILTEKYIDFMMNSNSTSQKPINYNQLKIPVTESISGSDLQLVRIDDEKISSASQVTVQDNSNDSRKDNSLINQDLINENSAHAIHETIKPNILLPLNQGETIHFVPIKPINFLCNKPIILCPCHTLNSNNQELGIEIVLLCRICNVVFRRRECYEAHIDSSPQCRFSLMKDQSPRIPKLFCSDCPWLLDSLPKMYTHLQIHAHLKNKDNVSFSCNICKIQFFGIGNIFHQHWYEHSDSPNFVASEYWLENYVFLDPNLAMTTSKVEEKFLCVAENVCPECKLFFNSEITLQEHKLRSCKFSLVISKTNAAADDVNIEIICQLCKLGYSTKGEFDRHCVEFNHVVPLKISYLEVSATLTERVFVCSLCDLRFTTSIEGMERHWKRIHCPQKILYTCKKCEIDFNFINNPNLYTFEKFKKHCNLRHKNETTKCLVFFHISKYSCVICKYGFANQQSLEKHQVLHENVLKTKQSTLTKHY